MALPEKAWSENAVTLAGKKIIKIEQVALSARLTGKNKLMLSCFNSITSFEKLVKSCLIDTLLIFY